MKGYATNSLQFSSWLPRSVAHGPGERFVVWVQGCSLACRGCFSPHTHTFRGGQPVGVRQLADTILGTKEIEGITISGGEPFQQAQALAGVTEIVRGTGLTVMCYTGFTLESLRGNRNPDVQRLLANIDILVDGPYVAKLATNLRWRGSGNQRIHWLTETYEHLKNDSDETSHVELVAKGDRYNATGIWPPGFLNAVRDVMNGERQ